MMKRLLIPALLALYACSSTEAVFSPLVFDTPAQDAPDGFYRNPILSGFYPDPSICRVGEDYWMVNSTFGYFPGLPVWHSTDLLHWEQCESALCRSDEFDVGNNNLVVGTFAPQISYNPKNGLYYIICTFVGGYGNFFITSSNPASGQWSSPVTLPEVPGIDHSILFDTDGKAYITSAAGIESLGERGLYANDSAIVLLEFDWENGRTRGDRQIIARHGVRPELHPQSLEGPHLYHIRDKYFLMCAEGGTELGHSEVLFSASTPYGPFEPCRINPILTQRNIPDPALRCTGHADLVESQGGNWYAVFLAVQSYEGDYTFNTGRQTCILPVGWQDGQPVIWPEGKEIPVLVPLTDEMRGLAQKNTIKGFDTRHPGALWSSEGPAKAALFIRNPEGDFWKTDKKGNLILKPKPVSLREQANPAGIFGRIGAENFELVTSMRFVPRMSSDGKVSEAGIVCFQNENGHFRFVKTLDGEGVPIMLLEEVRGGRSTRLFTEALSARESRGKLYLKVRADAPDYAFSISSDGKNYRQIGETLDGRSLKNPDLWGFTGAVYGVYASSASETPPAVSGALPRRQASEAQQTAFEAYLEAAAEAKEDLHSIMVLKDGAVILEKRFSPDTAHIMMSVSKTFTSAAVGFAISEGLLSLDDRIVDIFPEKVPDNPQKYLDSITIRHLLTMNSGHGTDPFNGVFAHRDWIRMFMEWPMEYEPGTCFCYNSIATFLLSAAVQRRCGQKMVDYLQPRLWAPLGIRTPRWDESPTGENCGGWGLYLHTEDMARMGQCLLDGGRYMGRQVIPAWWVKEMSSRQVDCCMAGLNSETVKQHSIGVNNDWIQGYGYQTWQCHIPGSYRADGAYGQFIIVLPEQNAVVVTTADIGNMYQEIDLIWKHLLPALDTD